MILELLLVSFISILPIFELRLAIPFGILALGLNPVLTFVVVILCNILIGIIVFFMVEFLIRIGCKFKFIKNIYDKKIIKVQEKIHPFVEKYGWVALPLFIGIPMPGSGVYTGALAAKLLGMKTKEFVISCILGVLLAGIIMLSLTLFFSEALSMMGVNISKVNVITRLFGL